MNKKILLACLVVGLSQIGLGGCAYAPGHNFSSFAKSDESVPEGALISITSELIHAQADERSQKKAEVQHLFGDPKPYVMGTGDVVSIVVWDHPEIALPAAGATGSLTDPSLTSAVGNGYNVGADGSVQLPYIGSVKLAGLTEEQARDALVQRFSKYIKSPEVTVRIQAYRSGRVFIDGEVRLPGLQALNDIPMTLPEAISRAGGLLPTANRSAIAITRQDQTTLVDLQQLTSQGINPNKILLQAGDMVRVTSREDSKVYVVGEVSRPVTLQMRNGQMSLNEALGEAGGVNPTSSDPRQIFVLRSVNADNQKIFHLNASSPVAYALAQGFELQPFDVVYVDPVPLVRWNRVISLIIPNASAVSSTNSSLK